MILVKQLLPVAGRWSTAVGVILLAIYTGSVIDRVVSSRLALRDFDEAQAVRRKYGPIPVALQADQPIDFSLWSEERVAAYNKNLRKKKISALAVLRIDRLNLSVPVFEGTDTWTLNRGAGWIAGTTPPGGAGNIGIAGHRDGFFRALKDIREGDAIELAFAAHTVTYKVDQVEIVDPEDVAVLQPRPLPSLTLVTCYPFYFVGEASQRFIVHAALNKQIQAF